MFNNSSVSPNIRSLIHAENRHFYGRLPPAAILMLVSLVSHQVGLFGRHKVAPVAGILYALRWKLLSCNHCQEMGQWLQLTPDWLQQSRQPIRGEESSLTQLWTMTTTQKFPSQVFGLDVRLEVGAVEEGHLALAAGVGFALVLSPLVVGHAAQTARRVVALRAGNLIFIL